ncbi:MAG: protein phosphatase 2C domain-containing protein [Lactobacillaceae bacterium]|jgi:protein phosphatase|nr:protein phosphatase 2C domain-containing protein [Lactobacillaceae bacterium]
MQIAYLSDTGTIKNDNQDFVGIFVNKHGFQLAIVADGVTSLKGGDVASEMVVHSLGHQWSISDVTSSIEARFWISDVAQNENLRILEASKKYTDLSNMATTFVAAAVFGNEILIANLGDSRAYLFSEDDMLTQLTDDHSLGNELLKRGLVKSDEMEFVPNNQAITRFFGSKRKIELDFKELSVNGEDILMLSTDGLSKEIDENDISRILRNKKISLGEMTAKLIDLANDQSGFDNVTVLLMSRFEKENN